MKLEAEVAVLTLEALQKAVHQFSVTAVSSAGAPVHLLGVFFLLPLFGDPQAADCIAAFDTLVRVAWRPGKAVDFVGATINACTVLGKYEFAV